MILVYDIFTKYIQTFSLHFTLLPFKNILHIIFEIIQT